jgi:hypothetical protein
MNNTTFHNTSFELGDETILDAGDVVTWNDGYGFSHSIILGFSDETEHGELFVKLARPYADVSNVVTTSPTALTGVEYYTLSTAKLKGCIVPWTKRTYSTPVLLERQRVVCWPTHGPVHVPLTKVSRDLETAVDEDDAVYESDPMREYLSPSWSR